MDFYAIQNKFIIIIIIIDNKLSNSNTHEWLFYAIDTFLRLTNLLKFFCDALFHGRDVSVFQVFCEMKDSRVDINAEFILCTG